MSCGHGTHPVYFFKKAVLLKNLNTHFQLSGVLAYLKNLLCLKTGFFNDSSVKGSSKALDKHDNQPKQQISSQYLAKILQNIKVEKENNISES